LDSQASPLVIGEPNPLVALDLQQDAEPAVQEFGLGLLLAIEPAGDHEDEELPRLQDEAEIHGRGFCQNIVCSAFIP